MDARGIGRRLGWISDLVHVALGVLTMALSALLGLWIGVLIACVYVAYQVVDWLMGEHWVETVIDLLEYLAGVVAGCVIVFNVPW